MLGYTNPATGNNTEAEGNFAVIAFVVVVLVVWFLWAAIRKFAASCKTEREKEAERRIREGKE